MKKASVGVKRLLMYALVLLCVLFVGFLAYFFARNDEIITFTLDEGSVVYVNVDDPIAWPIKHEDAHKDTKFEVNISDTSILTYTEATQTFEAVKGGMTSVTISTTNKNFGPYRFDVMVGEGSVANPWYVSTASQLASIGKTEQVSQLEGEQDEKAWTLTDSYQLINDINLSSCYNIEEGKYWTPIGTRLNPFAGKFNGNGFTISNLKVDSDLTELGLFGAVQTFADVEGIKFENASINAQTDSASAGIVAGVNFGTIARIIAQGTITANNANVGGIVGENIFSSVSPSVLNVSADITLNGTFKNAGGVVGLNAAGIIYNAKSQVSANITTLNGYFGGVVGVNGATNQGEYAYTRPVVKNTYTIIESINIVDNCAVIVGQNIEATNSYGEFNKYVSNFGTSSNLEKVCFAVVGTRPEFDTVMTEEDPSFEMMKTQEKGDLENQEMFTNAGWDFENAWYKEIYPEINLEGYTEYHNEYIPGSALTEKSQVLTAIEKLINNPNGNLTFTIESNNVIEIDCYTELKNNEEWTPVGTAQNPFNGNIIVKEGTTLILKNIKMTEKMWDFAGFFGVTDGATIKNITFKDVQIINPNDPSAEKINQAGTIVGASYKSNISDCKVDNVKIENYNIAGLVCGSVDGGTIVNCDVSDPYDTNTNLEGENVIKNTKNVNAVYGGIVGQLSNATVKDSLVGGGKIKSEVKNAFVNIGGIAGRVTSGTVSNCYNMGLGIESIQKIGQYGGVVGITSAKSTVELSYNLGKIEVSTSEQSYAGGIVGVTSSETEVKTSFSNTSLVQGQFVGGLVADNSGIITQCYSAGEYKGYDIGGFSYRNKGDINNCYTLASVVGIGNKKNVAAGMVAILPQGGSVKLCFSSASISGNDCHKFAETGARFRYPKFYQWWNTGLGSYYPGTLTNCVVVNYGDAEVQKSYVPFDKSDFIQCTDDDCRLKTTFNPFETAGFKTQSINIWDLEAGDGEYPTLKNCVKEYVIDEPVEEPPVEQPPVTE